GCGAGGGGVGRGGGGGGQEHGGACAPLAADAVPEGRLHQRVEAGRRLVEDQQFGVGGEGGDQRDRLPVALGIGAGLLRRVEVKALDELLASLGIVLAAAQPGEQVDDLPA